MICESLRSAHQVQGLGVEARVVESFLHTTPEQNAPSATPMEGFKSKGTQNDIRFFGSTLCLTYAQTHTHTHTHTH